MKPEIILEIVKKIYPIIRPELKKLADKTTSPVDDVVLAILDKLLI